MKKHVNAAFQAGLSIQNHRFSRFERPANNQTHAQLKRVWLWSKPLKDYELLQTGCDCRACKMHLELIGKLNPDRFNSLWNPPKPEDDLPFFRPKRVSPEQWFSRNKGKTLNRLSIL